MPDCIARKTPKTPLTPALVPAQPKHRSLAKSWVSLFPFASRKHPTSAIRSSTANQNSSQSGGSRLDRLATWILAKPVVGVGPARPQVSCGLAAIILLIGCNGLQTATADGDTRTLSMHHVHTDENITITFKRNGQYDEEALKKLNWFLRDWRRVEQTNMDPHLFDLIWEVSREVDEQKPIEVVCGYRSPETNAMLRRRSGGVARFSQHMLGRAMDFYIPGAALEDIRIAGLRLQRGGVGFYPTSGSPFVHLDTGSVRHWPRMTREQLARVFPDGRTVHVPSDGRPLPGYALALADIEKRGNDPSQTSLDAAHATGVAGADRPNRSLLAALIEPGKDRDEDDDADAAPDGAAPHRPTAIAAIASKPAPQSAPRIASSPTVATKAPAKVKQPATYELASAPLAPSFAPVNLGQVANQAASLVADTPTANEVIATRGYWSAVPNAPDEQRVKAAPPVRTAAAAPRPRAPAQTPVEPKLSASAGPFSAVTGDVASEDETAPEDVALAYASPQQDVESKVEFQACHCARGADGIAALPGRLCCRFVQSCDCDERSAEIACHSGGGATAFPAGAALICASCARAHARVHCRQGRRRFRRPLDARSRGGARPSELHDGHVVRRSGLAPAAAHDGKACRLGQDDVFVRPAARHRHRSFQWKRDRLSVDSQLHDADGLAPIAMHAEFCVHLCNRDARIF